MEKILHTIPVKNLMTATNSSMIMLQLFLQDLHWATKLLHLERDAFLSIIKNIIMIINIKNKVSSESK